MSLLPVYGFFVVLFFIFGKAHADSFDECPSSAYLIQGSSSRMYGVNLATGFYQLLSEDLGVEGKLNAMGFSIHDKYLYAYSTPLKTLVRIGRDFKSEVLIVDDAPNTNFYVGDVSLQANKYYAYRPGSSYGLYSISLDVESEDYLQASRIIDGGQLNITIYDFAFHPTNQQLYAVDRLGNLIVIDPSTGEDQTLGNVGESGTFGAVYFDSSGYFYISRNSDGYIFRIDLSTDSFEAEFFAFGPSSSNNDGARCATANIISDSSLVDFGNAPSSYGSDIEGNGARHEVSQSLYLGESWGGEDNGIEFITNVEPGLKSIVVAKVEGEGLINAWGDWNKNGAFDDSEQFIVDREADSGDNFIQIDVPSDAIAGETWTRIRFSTQGGIGANGGVADGEVEDYKIDVIEVGTAVSHYPSSSGFVTLAYEDNWPVVGDYDMNDVVVAMQTRHYSNTNDETIRYEITGKILALGAGYHNGFAVQMNGIPTSAIDIEKTHLFINGKLQAVSPLEQNQSADDAVFIVSEDLKSVLGSLQSCSYYRTERNCTDFEENQEFDFVLVVSLATLIPLSDSPRNILNPFIFATPGTYHGDTFSSPPGRSLEVHLKNEKVTSQFDETVMGSYDDRSDNVDQTFVTGNGLPWALEIPGIWSHPIEKQDLLNAYPLFRTFVESSSQESTTWYLDEHKSSGMTIQNTVEK